MDKYFFCEFQIPVHGGRDLDLGVIVTDSNGRRFNNFSSLAFDWELSDENVAAFGNSGKMTTAVTTTDTGKSLVDSELFCSRS